MKPIIFGFLFCISFLGFSQTDNNNKLDNPKEFTTKITVPFVMPDGVKLETDIYWPILSDNMNIDLTFPVNFFGIDYDLEGTVKLLKKGFQYVGYEKTNGIDNDSISRYQLPIVFTRTPYNKRDGQLQGAVFSLLGYGHAYQDMRGRYNSEGVYFPMYSDSWNKNPYHPDYDHIADITPLNDPKNSNKHEDGYWSVKYITDSLKMPTGIGSPLEGFNPCNGSIGMFGASALGNTQLQAASAHYVDTLGPGLKALMPIVATIEHYNSTGFPNGVFRERIVTGWLKGQLADLEEEEDILPVIDDQVHNTIHTPADFNATNRFAVAESSIDHFCCVNYFGEVSGAYPNSKIRAEMDASHAPVNNNGESVGADLTTPLPNLNYSRYNNMNVPIYHVTGWWDIYPEGQIETFLNTRKALPKNSKMWNLQKIVIGPWAHQTIGGNKTGDMTYPESVKKYTKISLDELDVDNIPVAELINSELVGWFRYNLNKGNAYKEIGDPVYIIPASNEWQGLGNIFSVRVPSREHTMTFAELYNFLNGSSGLEGIYVELKAFGQKMEIQLPAGAVPPLGSPVIDGLDPTPIDSVFIPDYINDVPAVRFWVGGNDSAERAVTGKEFGNYWFETSTFPIDWATENQRLYLHADGSANWSVPTGDEGFGIYVHDPDNPVTTVGGGNMIVRTPSGDRNSQGPMNLADPEFASLTMNRPGVLKFETEVLQDSMSIIGVPTAIIQAKTNPAGEVSGPTDTEFYVRVLDVFPDGREYFVVEGGVNARAREYAQSMTQGEFGVGNDEVAYSNIEIGKMYQYRFNLMPLAHTFGEGHKIKLLISSSNHPRYQSCPNLPIEDGEFFRRYPNDGQGYVFNGELMYPRKAVQRIHFSDQYGINSTNVSFPVYAQHMTFTDEKQVETPWDMQVFPNPSTGNFGIYTNKNLNHVKLRVLDLTGRVVMQKNALNAEHLIFNASHLEKGMYVVQLYDVNTHKTIVKPIVIN